MDCEEPGGLQYIEVYVKRDGDWWYKWRIRNKHPTRTIRARLHHHENIGQGSPFERVRHEKHVVKPGDDDLLSSGRRTDDGDVPEKWEVDGAVYMD